jgi:preprotein translocase subunit SecA
MVMQKIARVLGGDPHKREIEKLSLVVDEINQLEEPYEALSNAALAAKTNEFKQRLADGDTLDDLLPEAFAVVREASKRTLGLRHYDIQMIGGMTLHSGKIAEMRTGEGKTLVATLPLYLNALTGRGVHLVTVNDYLARRDARWMAPVYALLGLRVGVLQMAARTENGQKAFIVDLDKPNAREDLHLLTMVDRSEAYKADIVYGTNSEFGFDYLRDNLTMSLAERVQRGHYFAIVDEVDNILIDEARTPLIISGPAADESEGYQRMAQVVRALNPEDYEVNEKDRQVSLTEIGEAHVEEILNQPLRDPDRPEDVTPEQARLMGYLEQALRAQHLFRRNKDYIVQSGQVIIVDEFTGRLMPGRRWSEGLHQAVEAKEGVKIEPESVTYATITIQNYFRMYEKLAGMTGTAVTEAEEFSKIYKLDVLPIPMNLEYVASRADSPLTVVDTKDEQNYALQYYARKDEEERKPVFWRRQDFPDMVYRTEEGKLRAIVSEILHYYAKGRPQLVGTTSVEHSELLSQRLSAESVRRLAQALIIRDAWLEKYNKSPELEIKELQFLNRPLNELNVAEMRPIARQGGLSSINPEDPELLTRLLKILDVAPENSPRVVAALQGGLPHQVLNARKHDEESQIIAKAGSFGSITIATNMAGRGVDIKLGGELNEEILADVIRVLEKAGVADPYNLSNDARRVELEKLTEDDYGIYSESVHTFIDYLEDMKRVRALGGLHVIGSERHEARRIDNQLRGRAARQGDPGSSRFYLSLEDELMRLFGGAQMETLMTRMKVDPSLPIESGILGRMVEQAQERVEGNNFDVRKHLLEYDDVLNSQRKRIYAERDRAFQKDDLHDDIVEILRTELNERIPKALADEEGPWKLLGYLEEVQPSMSFETEGIRVPSFTLRLMVNEFRSKLEQGSDDNEIKNSLLEIAENSLRAEQEHILNTTRVLLEKTEETVDELTRDRLDTIDTFFDGLEDARGDEEFASRRPQQLLEELSNLTRTQLRLTSEELRALPEADRNVKDKISDQVTRGLNMLAITRTIGSVERRLDESLNMRPADLQELDWAEVADGILDQVSATLENRTSSLLAPQGQINSNIDAVLTRTQSGSINEDRLVDLLMNMSFGTRMAIDARTHQRGMKRVLLVNYIFYAARLLQDRPVAEITREVLDHLEMVQQRLETVWGKIEYERFRLSGATLKNLDPQIKNALQTEIGEEEFNNLQESHPDTLSDQVREKLEIILGRRIQNQIHRHILLSVISELWVDYLTRVDALRVSIGLEAFAQRDPLVQYKGQASEMFRTLLSDIRAGVISRMFLFQPRRAGTQATEKTITETAPPQVRQDASQVTGGKKKKRKRH